MRFESIFYLFVVIVSCHGLSKIKNDSRNKKKSNFQQMIGTSEQTSEMLSKLLQENQLQVLTFAESLLKKTVNFFDDFNKNTEKLQNVTNGKVKTTKNLRYLKQKAKHLRTNIKNDIETIRENIEEKAKETEKKFMTDSNIKLNETLRKSNILNDSPMKTKSTIKKFFFKKDKPIKQGCKCKTKENEPTSTTTVASVLKKRPTIPNVSIGLGDGFGGHT